MTFEEAEAKIREIFEQNYEMIRLEGGHSLAEDSKQYALNQVIYYYKKLSEVAQKVTETEVKLSLPEQKTPEKRRFTIEGVVDIVREDDEIWMYDIKTHDPEYVSAHKDLYEKQLNVYRHIWENLRGNKLDNTAIISTAYPQGLKNAIRGGDKQHIEHELKKWQPVIEIPSNEESVNQTIDDFARIVDLIEDHCFSPKPVEEIKEKIKGTNQLFVTRVCRNCDARFSCDSFRTYVLEAGDKSRNAFKQYFEDFGTQEEREDFITGNLDMSIINELTEQSE